jgi:hypothetical protein
MTPEGRRYWALTRALAWLVIALMAAATLYTGWIALVNFDRIAV